MARLLPGRPHGTSFTEHPEIPNPSASNSTRTVSFEGVLLGEVGKCPLTGEPLVLDSDWLTPTAPPDGATGRDASAPGDATTPAGGSFGSERRIVRIRDATGPDTVDLYLIGSCQHRAAPAGLMPGATVTVRCAPGRSHRQYSPTTV
eukprot:560625-Pyramimonas_sp.AAC.1